MTKKNWKGTSGVGAVHIHKGIPHVQSKAGVAGGAGASSSTSLSTKDESLAKFSLSTEVLSPSTALLTACMVGFGLILVHMEHECRQTLASVIPCFSQHQQHIQKETKKEFPLQQMGEYLLGRSRIVAVGTNSNR